MPPKRALVRNEHDNPTMPVYLVHLRDRGVLKARRCRAYDIRRGMRFVYFRHNGLREREARVIGLYLLHTSALERGDWLDRLIHGTSSYNYRKIVDMIQLKSKALGRHLKRKQTQGLPIAIDATGVIHH